MIQRVSRLPTATCDPEMEVEARYAWTADHVRYAFPQTLPSSRWGSQLSLLQRLCETLSIWLLPRPLPSIACLNAGLSPVFLLLFFTAAT